MSPASAIRLASALLWLVLTLGPCAFASDQSPDLRQYAHATWKVEDGTLTAPILTVAQTSDGYLWFGTNSGVLRFDGVRFVPWDWAGGPEWLRGHITAMLGTRDGALWIGTLSGLVRWNGRTLATYPSLNGAIIATLAQDHEGTVWAGVQAAGGGRLCAIRDSNTECSANDGRFGSDVAAIYEDSQRVLWISTAAGVWRWRPGPPVRYAVPDSEVAGNDNLTEATPGVVLVSTSAIWRLRDDKVEPFLLPAGVHAFHPLHPFHDRHGSIWIGTRQGLVHLHGGRADTFSQSDGLSGAEITAILEDREGNVWVATAGGLDRFRPFAAATHSLTPGATTSAVLSDPDGSTWVATVKGLFRIRDARVTVYRGRHEEQPSPPGDEVIVTSLPDLTAASLFRDSTGRVWIGTFGVFGYLAGSQFITVDRVPHGYIDAFVEDAAGNIWVGHRDAGLLRVSRDGAVQSVPIGADRQPGSAYRLALDSSGRGLWIGSLAGNVLHMIDGKIRETHSTGTGPAVYLGDLRVTAGDTAWAATRSGLYRIHSGRIATLDRRNGLPCDAVDSTIEDGTGSMWLYTACGLVRIERADVNRWSAAADRGDTSAVVRPTVLDASDGVLNRAFPFPSTATPHLARASDGTLWFLTLGGVAVVDAARLPRNEFPPPVHIAQLMADGKAYDVSSDRGIELPALTRELQIEYTALSFVAPEKNRYRVKLDGWDPDWIDMGSERQKSYGNLPPRTYHFRVIAANNSGVWNETGAFIDFSLPPAYYQTFWFRALILGMVVSFVWTAHRIRLHIVETHEREITALNERLMKAQEQERIRIAGELHDGVMQQMLSVTMLLGGAKRRVASNPAEATATIDKAQEKLIQAGTDIRQLSHGLHPPILQEAGLAEAVRSYCAEFSTARGIPVMCDADESARDLSRGAALALFRVMQEALGNAAKHANARRIAVHLKRANGTVSLTVSDDGRGVDSARIGTSGGLGLVMMRERATQLNGAFHFESAPGHGTTIRVEIPFR